MTEHKPINAALKITFSDTHGGFNGHSDVLLKRVGNGPYKPFRAGFTNVSGTTHPNTDHATIGTLVVEAHKGNLAIDKGNGPEPIQPWDI